jgi:hypothetical protein
MEELIIKNKYKRRDSAIINLHPETKGRISFYKLALHQKSYDETLQLLMDIAQQRINEISVENYAKSKSLD